MPDADPDPAIDSPTLGPAPGPTPAPEPAQGDTADTADVAVEHGAGQRRPQRLGRWVIAAVLVLVLAWLALAGLQLRSAASETRAGVDELESLRGVVSGDLQRFVDAVGGEGGDVGSGQDGNSGGEGDVSDSAIAGLRSAEAEFASAADRVESPLVAPLKVLPMIGRQLRSVDALTTAAEDLTRSTADAIEALSAEADRGAGSAAERLAAAQRTVMVVDELAAHLDAIDLGPSDALVRPLADARNRFAEEHQQLVDTVEQATVAVRGVSDFLEGPTRYLVLANNNSEMRAGGGMPLQIGELEVVDGEMHLGEFSTTAELTLSEPGAEVDPDVAALWSWLLPSQEWRNVNVTPRFDETARMATEMWASAGRGAVDGVMAVDVVGLQQLLVLTGPVDVPGSPDDPEPFTVDADTIHGTILIDQYLGYTEGSDAEALTATRRNRLGRVASAVFDAVNTRSVSVSELIGVLEGTGAGRHVTFWSNVPVQQAGWEALGASGVLAEDTLLFSVLNRFGNKLDQFLHVDAVLDATVDGDLRRVTVDVTLTNTTPEGLPRYIAGPFAEGAAAGDYGGILTLAMPAGAGNPEVTGARAVLAGPDGPTRVIGAEIRLPRGTSTELTIAFDLPVAWESIEVIPSARVPPVQWTAGDRTFADIRPERIELDDLS